MLPRGLVHGQPVLAGACSCQVSGWLLGLAKWIRALGNAPSLCAQQLQDGRVEFQAGCQRWRRALQAFHPA